MKECCEITTINVVIKIFYNPDCQTTIIERSVLVKRETIRRYIFLIISIFIHANAFAEGSTAQLFQGTKFFEP